MTKCTPPPQKPYKDTTSVNSTCSPTRIPLSKSPQWSTRISTQTPFRSVLRSCRGCSRSLRSRSSSSRRISTSFSKNWRKRRGTRGSRWRTRTEWCRVRSRTGLEDGSHRLRGSQWLRRKRRRGKSWGRSRQRLWGWSRSSMMWLRVRWGKRRTIIGRRRCILMWSLKLTQGGVNSEEGKKREIRYMLIRRKLF